MPSNMKNKKMGKMPKESYESEMKKIKPCGVKYSSDNVKELSDSVEKLGSYVKNHKMKY